MARIPTILTVDRVVGRVQEGESTDVFAVCRAVPVPPATTGTALNKAALLTLTLTLLVEKDGTVINGRDDQDILDNNGGSVSVDGAIILRLQPDDNVIVSSDVEPEKDERHILRFKFTWDDGVLIRTGIDERILLVQRLVAPL